MGDRMLTLIVSRVDAVDNVDADLLQGFIQTTSETAFGVDKSEANALAHISIP